MCALMAVISLLGMLLSVKADSEVWSYRQNFVYDPWDTAILPYVATVPQGKRIDPANIRAVVSPTDLAVLRERAAGGRLVKRQVVKAFKSDGDVAHARSYLLLPDESMAVDIFQTTAGYLD